MLLASASSLFLVPADSGLISRERVRGALAHLQFIAGEKDLERFSPGSEYLQLITYLGCSPVINPLPTEDTQIFISPVFTSPRVLLGQKAKSPKCRSCGQLLFDLSRLGATLQAQVVCPHCSAQQLVTEIVWRHQAACCHFFVQITGIHPHEALPTDQLLDALAQCAGGTPWRVLYCEHPRVLRVLEEVD